MTAPRIVVLGMMTKIPVGGVVWQTLHYVEGFRRLGCDVRYVEAHARTPSMFMATETDDGSGRAAAFVAEAMARIGMADRWALWALHDDGAVHGATRDELDRWLRDADAVINLHGGTDPALVEAAAGRLVYLETDPVQLQIELHDGVDATREFLDAHHTFLTFGELWGRPGCRLPTTDRYVFHPTRQPVVLDWWCAPPPDAAHPITTVANWRQPWRDVTFDGERYGWSKDREFEVVLDLPGHVPGASFELALSGATDDDRERLESRGWAVADGLAVSRDADRYRTYVSGSLAEFTVAKDQNVRLRSGWFSDRSATYLAAGRPVVTQATGFEDVLPTGAGLHAFDDLDGAAAAVDAVLADPLGQGAAAAEVAREYFAHDRVLTPLLELVGLRTWRGTRTGRLLRPDLPLRPASRRPLRLADGVEDAAKAHPLPVALPARLADPPDLSVVVVTWNHLGITRLCLDSLLCDPTLTGAEIVVVDNGSTDGTPDVIAAMSRRHRSVRLIANSANRGFAAATNQGVAVARAERIVLLNNDTVVPPGALLRLVAHLDDPTIGIVGAVAPHAGNDAKVPQDYDTYDELVRRAAERATARRGETAAVPMVTMFCAALRREVLDAVGPLDETFETGMFEDDDYAARLGVAGFRCALALDTLVHHFGEASFGDLFASGEHGRLFRANRDRFEDKWEATWHSHARAPDDGYAAVRDRIARLVAAVTPAGSAVAVVSNGDPAMGAVEGRTTRHLPCDDAGVELGHHPADATAAAAQIDAAIAAGVGFVLVPDTSRWWLDHYRGLDDRLRRQGDAIADIAGTGLLVEIGTDR